LLVYALVSFVIKHILYRWIYGFIILDLVIIYYMEHKRFERRIFLFGAAIFSMFCSLSYCLFALVEMKNLHAPTWMLQSFLVFSTAVVIHSAGAYFHLSWIVKRRINRVMQMIAQDPKSAGVGVDQNNFRIDLGKEVRFESGSFTISPAAGQFLRSYIPVLLRAKESPEGQRWIRSVVIEGFTDEDGTYLYNLRLSLDRSRSVVCSLFQANGAADALNPEQLRKVQELFLVGGYSFNSIKKDKSESRRVEFKIDFWGLEERVPAVNDVLRDKEFGRC